LLPSGRQIGPGIFPPYRETPTGISIPKFNFVEKKYAPQLGKSHANAANGQKTPVSSFGGMSTYAGIAATYHGGNFFVTFGWCWRGPAGESVILIFQPISPGILYSC
jgi:hypothetical protein